MNRSDNIKKFFDKAAVNTNWQMDEAVFNHILAAQYKMHPAKTRPVLWRIIMKSKITKYAAGAVIIIAVLIGIYYSGGSIDGSGVVWADVIKQIENSRGLIVRVTEAPYNPDNYTIYYKKPQYSRADSYKENHLDHSLYEDYETMTAIFIRHTQKQYTVTKPNTADNFLDRNEDWINPLYTTERILSCEYKKLEPEIVEGIFCEGIETTDPDILGPIPETLEAIYTNMEVQIRLWIDINTQYPVMMDCKLKANVDGNVVEGGAIIDQFKWDVDIDPSIFEPNIPPDYTDMRSR